MLRGQAPGYSVPPSPPLGPRPFLLRPHVSLDGETPARAAQIVLPLNDGWGDLMTWATVYRTLCQMERQDGPTLG